jgi:ankyrin repeat protein
MAPCALFLFSLPVLSSCSLSQNPTDVNAAREDGITPVFTAAWLGRVQVLKVLLENGALPNPPAR